MKKSKKILSVLLAVLMFMSIVPVSDMGIEASAATLTDSEITRIVENYLSIVGTNKYWNAGYTTEELISQVNSGDYLSATTSSQCVKWSSSGSHVRANGCTSNSFTGVSRGISQCWGFGDYMEYVIFKTTNGADWKTTYSVTSDYKFRPGDLIKSTKNSSSQHIVVVYKVENSHVYIIEANYGGRCKINTRELVDPHSYVNASSSYVMSPPSYLRTDNHTHSYKTGQYKTTASSGLILRGSASTSGSYLDLIPNGTTVNVTSISGNWGYTKYNGQNGWICLDYATYINHTHSYTSKVTTSPTCYSTGVKTYTCSCGSSYTESISKTSHDYTGQQVYESAHPHEISQRCVNYASCGAYKWTGENHSVRTCSQCWDIKFTTNKNSMTIQGGKSDTFTLGMTGSIYPDGAKYDWEYDETIISVERNGNDFTVTGLKYGKTDLVFTAYTDSSLSTTITSMTIPISVTGLYNIWYFPNLTENEQFVSQRFASQIKYYGEDLTITTKKPEKDGYSFRGWSASSSATTPTYLPGGIYSANSEAVLYAVWKKVFYGDTNNDGEISAVDLTDFTKALKNVNSITPESKFMYDLNGDGDFDEDDLSLAVKFYKKEIHVFPVENMSRKINIKSQPEKLVYKHGETISSTGLKINVIYNNKITHSLDSGFTISPTTASGSGKQKITVSLGDLSTYFYITVDNHVHSYTSKITTAPTCAKTGVRTYTCACGTSYTETVSIDSTNHAYSTQIKNKQAATCKTQGYTGDTYCTGCSAKLKTGSVIAKTSHSYGSWITTTEATCTSAGARKKVCSVCNNAVTETVSALGHSFGAYASNNDATYKADGTKTAKCSLCNQSKTVTDKGSRLTVKKPYSVKIEKSTSAVRLTWDKCIGADGYRVFQKTSSGWKTLGTVTKLTGTIRNLKSGTTYTFAIQPYTNINGAKAWGEYLAVTVSTLPVAPTAKVSSPSKGAVKVSWNNVNGAQKYQLYYKVNNGSYKLYKTYNSAQNLTFKNLKSGAKYTFTVRAYRTVNECNYYSSYKPVTVTIK